MGTRASNNESSIHQDGTGRWHGYVSMGLKDGGRRDRFPASRGRCARSAQSASHKACC